MDADNQVRRVFADKKPFKGSEICRLKALYAETDSNSKANKGKKRSRSKWNQSPAILLLFKHPAPQPPRLQRQELANLLLSQLGLRLRFQGISPLQRPRQIRHPCSVSTEWFGFWTGSDSEYPTGRRAWVTDSSSSANPKYRKSGRSYFCCSSKTWTWGADCLP